VREPCPANLRLPRMRTTFLLAIMVGALAACAAGAGGSPDASLPASPPGDATAAARLVLATNPRFAGIEKRDPALIGQASWYEVTARDGGWAVSVRIGWGDCPSGCIHQHRWTFSVSSAGGVTPTGESGDALPHAGAVTGNVTAGPVCPVERVPPDPSCAPRPVAGALLIVQTTAGREVARTTSAADGTFHLTLAPGAYHLVPQPVAAYMGTAPRIDFRVEVGEPTPELEVSYDTGIR
jgi:hypothetical protein